MLHEEIIAFKFKGNRQYVHGTDIIDSVIKKVEEKFGEYPDSIKGSFHRRLKSHGKIRIYPQSKALKDITYNSLFTIEVKEKEYLVTLSQTDRPIKSAYTYDEEAVTLGMVYRDKSVQITVNNNYSFIEQIVALTKKLHLNIYPNSIGNWFFTKIQMQLSIAPKLIPGRYLMIKARKNFHNKLTQNLIYLDTEFIGDIWFSLLPKGEKK